MDSSVVSLDMMYTEDRPLFLIESREHAAWTALLLRWLAPESLAQSVYGAVIRKGPILEHKYTFERKALSKNFTSP
jgi:hypothetical protein